MPLIDLDSNTIITESTLAQVLDIQKADVKKQKSNGKQQYEIDLDKVMKRAGTDLTGEFVAMEYDHADGYVVSSWLTKTKTNGNIHYQYIAFPVEFLEDYYFDHFDAKFTDLLMNYDVFLFCDCKSFRYHFSNRDNVENTLYKGGREDWNALINYPVEGLYSVNPDRLGGLCKHLTFIIGSIFRTNWMSFKRDINKLIKNDIELYELLTLNDIKEEIPEEIDKEVEQILGEVIKADEEVLNLNEQFDKIILDYNTGITDENYAEKKELFDTEAGGILDLASRKTDSMRNFNNKLERTLRKYDEGSVNYDELKGIEEVWETVQANYELLIGDMEKMINAEY